jgi:hypothetical protein
MTSNENCGNDRQERGAARVFEREVPIKRTSERLSALTISASSDERSRQVAFRVAALLRKTGERELA